MFIKEFISSLKKRISKKDETVNIPIFKVGDRVRAIHKLYFFGEEFKFANVGNITEIKFEQKHLSSKGKIHLSYRVRSNDTNFYFDSWCEEKDMTLYSIEDERDDKINNIIR